MAERFPQAQVVCRGVGLPVVTLHGNELDHRLLLALDPVLQAAGGLERVYFDLPGFGTTPALAGAGGLPELADWLVDHVAQLVGDSRFALLANSLGGLLARHVRAQLPEQVVGLALLAPVVDPDHTRRRLPAFEVVEKDELLLASLAEDDREEFAGMTAHQTFRAWEMFAASVLPAVRAADRDAVERLGRRYFLTRTPEDGLEPFAGPTLVITGRQDHVVGYEDQFELVRTHYPSATYVAFHGAGHNVHIDCPDETAVLLGQWARSLPRTG